METCTITMTVNTVGINRDNVNSHVVFTDSYNDPETQSPVDFTSNIEIGDKIYWVAAVADPSTGDSVQISFVQHERDTNIIGQERVYPNPEGKFEATAIYGTTGDEEEYGIQFTVIKASGEQLPLYVDPKLKIQKHDE